MFWHSFIGGPIGGEYTEPAILHDAVCRSGWFSVKFCDQLMKEAMVAHGTHEETINAIMLGLGVSRLWRRKLPVDPTASNPMQLWRKNEN